MVEKMLSQDIHTYKGFIRRTYILYTRVYYETQPQKFMYLHNMSYIVYVYIDIIRILARFRLFLYIFIYFFYCMYFLLLILFALNLCLKL